MKLKLKNETHYKSSDLRKLFKECMKREGVEKCILTVKYQKRTHTLKEYKTDTGKKLISYVSGWAFLNDYRVKMLLPKYYYKSTEGKIKEVKSVIQKIPIDMVVWIAQIFRHELHHNLGLHHKDMIDVEKIDCEWARDFKITGEVKEEEKPVQSLIYLEFEEKRKEENKRKRLFARYEKALSKVKQFETKIRRSKTFLKKWQNKVKYYENKYCFNNQKEKK